MLFPVAAIARKKQSIETATVSAESGLVFFVDEANRVWLIEKATCMYEKYTQLLQQRKQELSDNRCLFVYFFPCASTEELDDLYENAIAQYQPALQVEECEALPLSDLGYSYNDYISRYHELTTMIKMLESERSDLKPNIVTLLEESANGKISGDGYTISLGKKAKYKYSPETTALEKLLKEKKKEEEKNGVATTVSYSVYPVLK